ncbi:MAG TPA: hypothetical protein VH207_00075 [Chthoniobacterales bacterium]|jgi:hypothetical protein|nr:hypothetical protein [Chthoniobacterales bacterium]
MAPFLKKFLLAAVMTAFLAGKPPAVASNPIGDFFKNLGRTLGHWRSNPTPPPPRPPRKSTNKKANAAEKEETAPEPMKKVVPSPTPTPIEIRPAALAPRTKKPRDVPYAVAVPNKPGFVTSPYAPDQGLVDVRAFPSSTEVLDPFTGKIFLTP